MSCTCRYYRCIGTGYKITDLYTRGYFQLCRYHRYVHPTYQCDTSYRYYRYIHPTHHTEIRNIDTTDICIRCIDITDLNIRGYSQQYRYYRCMHPTYQCGNITYRYYRYIHTTHHIEIRYIDMGWLRLVGSLKVQVSFAKEPYKRDDILQKRHIILRRLLIVATPYYKCM